MEFEYIILIESGTNGYYDYDSCNLCIKNSFIINIPLAKGDKITIDNVLYIVREIHYDGYENRCYVDRVYQGEENRYIHYINDVVELIDNDDLENLKLFAESWKQYREKHNLPEKY